MTLSRKAKAGEAMVTANGKWPGGRRWKRCQVAGTSNPKGEGGSVLMRARVGGNFGHAKSGSLNPVRAIELRVNGADIVIEGSADISMLEVLREKLGLTGTKDGCGRGECGACTVLLNEKPVLACLLLAQQVAGELLTIEGIAERERDLRESFAERGGFQCGFCTPGQVVAASTVLREVASPLTERDVRLAMSGNICRCTGYVGIVEAIRETALRRLQGEVSS